MDSSLQDLLSQLEAEVEDADEGRAETFLLYSQPLLSQNLGFIDPKASVLDVVVGGKDFSIHQSPGLLSSTRAGGTTGAVLWKVTPLFAEYISAPSNLFFRSGVLGPRSAILELGCGISPLNALALSSRVGRYVLTDQAYVQKLVERNLLENLPFSASSSSASSASASSSSSSSRRVKKGLKTTITTTTTTTTPTTTANMHFQTLDWETDQPSPSSPSFDALIACDCVFNYALIQPFVQTCIDVCKLHPSETPPFLLLPAEQEEQQRRPPCLCIIAQQLRNDDVFRSWLVAFSEAFCVWRVPGETLPEELRPGVGFVVHVGVLREYKS